VPRILSSILLISILSITAVAQGQNAAVQSPTISANYPANKAGVLIEGSQWTEVPNAFPFKTRARRGIAASLSYGLVPAKVVAEYRGDHAPVQVNPGQPVIRICHMISLPGQPVIVRLYPKKDARELDGGKMIVYPVVGGSKMADATKSDLVPVDISQPAPQVWLVRPQEALEPGEYGLMLGTQNLSIFPFTVAETPPSSASAK
jgi:hypothetical protein